MANKSDNKSGTDSNMPRERTDDLPEAVPAFASSYSNFTFEIEGEEGLFLNLEGSDTTDINELFPDDDMFFNMEGADDMKELPATGSHNLSDVMHWEKEDGAKFMRQQQNMRNDDETSSSVSSSASASAAASEPLSVSMSASLPQNESQSYQDKYEAYRMSQAQKIQERQMKQMCLSTSPVPGLQLIDAPVDVEGVKYEPLDPDYEELLKRAISKPIPIPNGPNTPKRCYAARRLRVSPISPPKGDIDDDEVDFDEGVFSMSLPADHIALDPDTPFISMMPGNRKRNAQMDPLE